MSVTVPGSNKPVDVEGEVRWTSESSRRGRCGIMFRRGHESLLMSLLTVFIGGATAMTTQAATTVPTFDPNADVVLDMNGGVDMPDSHTVLQAVTGSYDAIDTCVAQSRGKKKRITGDAHVAVLLNPQGRTPLGVNAELPRALAKNVKLKECVRSAVATAPYPSYDGPPVVVELDVELDPGEMEFPE